MNKMYRSIRKAVTDHGDNWADATYSRELRNAHGMARIRDHARMNASVKARKDRTAGK